MNFIILFFTLLLSTATLAHEQLIVEPDDGRAPLLNAITHAQSSIDLVMYGLTDQQFINALVQAKNHGKNVRVLLETHPYKSEGENNRAAARFTYKNIDWQPANPAFKLTHQKTLLLDQHQAIVMTFNLTHSTFKDQRNFALMTDDADEVAEIQQVFASDWKRAPAIAVHHSNLVWAPNNSREKLNEFISQARSSIKMYAQDLSDYQTIGLLAKKARAGIPVEVLLDHENENNRRKIAYLRRAGIVVKISHSYVIHAKVIIIDSQHALLGSMNFTRPSLEDNRELDVMTHDKNVVKRLVNVFNEDWKASEGLNVGWAKRSVPTTDNIFHSQ